MKIPGRYRRLFMVAAFLALLFSIAEAFGLREHFSLEQLQTQLNQHPVGGLLAFVALFSIGNLIQIPGWVFLASAVLALGKLPGGIATYIAASVSCVVTFVSVRTIGGNALQQLRNNTAQRLLGHLHARPVGVIALLRMLFQTLPALNYTLALTGVGLRKYLAGTLLGLPLPIAVYCVFFDYLAHLLQ